MGGIRDVEFTIQFLQLLNGGDLPAVRGFDGKGDPQVCRQLVQVESVDGHQNAGATA